jgi:hypothetical protein
MGYDLHITRKAHWSDEDGSVITADEWRVLIDGDAQLRENDGALYYDAGEITAKNPDEPLIRKMVEIAQKLDARVQGDDGEIYRGDGSSFEPDVPLPPAVGLAGRIGAWFKGRRVMREAQQAAPELRVGQRVRTPWKELGTVLKVDRKANAGMGQVHVRLDDGREQSGWSYVASALEIVDESPK